MRQHMKTYVGTGSTQTPEHGRGQRIPKKNARYDEEDDDDSLIAPAAKVCQL